MPRIQIKRGLKANLPTASMLSGEAHFTTDRGTLHVATGATTRLPVVPAIDDLTTIAAVDGAADFLILHDASASGQKEGKITVNAFKTALNIPASDLDEKAAIVAGGTSGYIWALLYLAYPSDSTHCFQPVTRLGCMGQSAKKWTHLLRVTKQCGGISLFGNSTSGDSINPDGGLLT